MRRPSPNQPVVVSVVGLVHTPGLVTLAPGARIADALKAAGGTTDGADTVGLNMARQVDDGEQIVVGIAPVKGQPPVLGSSVSSGSAAPGPPGTGSHPDRPSRPDKPGRSEAVNLNTATVQQLDALPGVGPVTAAAIVAWRDANGKFTSVDQLAEVDGIGPARLEKLRRAGSCLRPVQQPSGGDAATARLDARLVPAALTSWVVTAAGIWWPIGSVVGSVCAAGSVFGVLLWRAGHRSPRMRAIGVGVVVVGVVGAGFGFAIALRANAVARHPVAAAFGTAAEVVVTPSESALALGRGRLMFRATLQATRTRQDLRPRGGFRAGPRLQRGDGRSANALPRQNRSPQPTRPDGGGGERDR